MITGLERIAENKFKYPESKHINLIRYVNEDNLHQVFQRLNKKQAVGVDGVNKEKYEKHLKENLSDVVKRIKTFSYHPLPVRRLYIPKVGSEKM